MNKRKKAQGLKGLPGWMASYADMFTVLMAFFVLLFAMSIVDEELFQAFIASFNPARADDFMDIGGGGYIFIDGDLGIFPDLPPPPPPGDGGEEATGEDGVLEDGDAVGDMMNTFMTYMAEELGGEWEGGFDLQVEEGDGYLRIIMESDDGMHFNSGQARLMPAAIEALNAIGPILQQFAYEGHGIIVEGHTDNIPISTAAFPSNWTLSAARATAVVEFLTTEWFIDPRTIIAIGRGEYLPRATNETPEGRAQNRRVEIKVFTLEATGPAVGGGTWWAIPIN